MYPQKPKTSPLLDNYVFYDSKQAVSPQGIYPLYRFTRWGKSRTVDQLERMIHGSSLCCSVHYENREIVAFCRVLTDFIFRATLWDVLVHPDHQGKGVGSALMEYALQHPSLRQIPLILAFTGDLGPFLGKFGFSKSDSTYVLLRRPLEYS